MADEQKTEETNTEETQENNATQNKGDGQQHTEKQNTAQAGMFTPEQQSKVQELIDAAYTKAFKKAEEKLAAKSREKKPVKQDTTLPDEAMSQLKGQVEALRSEKKTNALLKAISKHNVMDAEEIAALTSSAVKLNDDNTISIVNENGLERLNADGRAMTVDEYITGWLTTRPHHIRSGGGQGAGSQSAKFGGDAGGANITTPEDIQNLSDKDFKKLISEGVNVKGSRGQTLHFKEITNPFSKTG